jgi:hypothetical protein
MADLLREWLQDAAAIESSNFEEVRAGLAAWRCAAAHQSSAQWWCCRAPVE